MRVPPMGAPGAAGLTGATGATSGSESGWRKHKTRVVQALDQLMHRAGISNALFSTLCAVAGSSVLSACAFHWGGAGAFCCARLNPDIFGSADVRRFHDRLGERRTMVAPGTWFGDSAHVIRIGLAYPPDDELEKGLAVISDALRP